MADIDVAVLDTSDESIQIEHNTTMFNNEILKQRLGCIPVFMNDLNDSVKDLQLVLDRENTSNSLNMLQQRILN